MKIVISEEQLKVILEDLVNEQNFDQDFVDSILDKINKQGIESVTPREMEYLEKIRTDTSGKYIPTPDENDQAEDNEPENDKIDSLFEILETPEFLDIAATKEFIILLDRYNLVKMDDIEISGPLLFFPRFIRINSVENKKLADMFDGGYFTAFLNKAPNGYILVTIMKGNLKDFVFDMVTDYIRNTWPKKIPKLKFRFSG